MGSNSEFKNRERKQNRTQTSATNVTGNTLINEDNRSKKRISFCNCNTLYLVPLDDIILIKVNDYVLRVEFVNGETTKNIGLTDTLKIYEDKLRAFGFVRVNHKTLVNVKFIRQRKTKNGEQIIVLNDDEISVSRRKWPDLKRFIEQWSVK